MSQKFKEFAISSWAIDNRTTIYMLTLVIVIIGSVTFNSLPKENFPEVQFPVIFVATPYPGTSPSDMENLVTRELEKEINSIEGIKKISSNSVQDYSSVFIEFETGVDLDQAKRDVQEAVDKAKSDLPNDLPNDPNVQDINMSEVPIMFLNISGPFDNVTLKRFAEELQDEIEKMGEIRRADLVGALDQEIQIDVDLYKMEAASISLGDIEGAVASENVNVSGGELDISNQKVAVRVQGEFQTVRDLEDIVIRSAKGNIVYLRDIATVVDGFHDRESYARLDGNPVMTLNIVKKAGENLVVAADEIKAIIADLEETTFPENLTIAISGDQSQMTRNTLNELTNTIIIGFILVTLVLLFFMGVRDALFVGLAVPLSSLMAFAVLPIFGFTLNLVVLFAFILAMGIVVDNAIVVIENTYRIFNEEDVPIEIAAKKAAGEVIGPVFAGTLTTAAPFVPLLFWDSIVGSFMRFMPVTMLITLFASLFVAYVINPVFATSFMTKDDPDAKVPHKQILAYVVGAVILGLLIHLGGSRMFGNLMFFMAVFVLLNAYVLRGVVRWFQANIIASAKNAYRNILAWSLEGRRPWLVMGGVFVTLILTIMIIVVNPSKVIFFPDTDPNFVYVYNEFPIGTEVEATDSITKVIEKRVKDVFGEDNPNVKSIITNVAIGAGDAASFDQGGASPNKSKISIEFVQVKERTPGASTFAYLEEVREQVKGMAGVKIKVDKEASGPPVAAPVELQFTSENYGELINVSKQALNYLDSLNIPGIEALNWDLQGEKPEMLVQINREKARELGVSTGQIGSALRTAIFGKEVSTFRANEDEYPIQLRIDDRYKEDLSTLLNMRISFMDQALGRHRSVPISSFADIQYTQTYGEINRTDLEKSIKITSNVLSDYNVVEVNEEVAYWMAEFNKLKKPSREVEIKIGGETEEQEKEAAFLGGAFMFSLIMIFMILITQFNSFGKVMIILSQVVLSIIGVFLGFSLSGMDFSVVMSGVGLVALIGIVVNNGIILLDFFQIQENRGIPLKEAIIEGGAIRFTPVLLTASSTILGLVPLATSLNINFSTLITHLDPQIFFGGDSAAFWSPLSWTIIFGLTFATVVTLLVVPIMYYLTMKGTDRFMEYFRLGAYSEKHIVYEVSGEGNEDDLIEG